MFWGLDQRVYNVCMNIFRVTTDSMLNTPTTSPELASEVVGQIPGLTPDEYEWTVTRLVKTGIAYLRGKWLIYHGVNGSPNSHEFELRNDARKAGQTYIIEI